LNGSAFLPTNTAHDLKPSYASLAVWAVPLWRRSVFCLVGLGLALVAGCQTAGFYAQAIHGQCQIIHRQRPIKDLLADSRTPAPLKTNLQFVLQVREFAQRELRLPVNSHYLDYADLGRPFAVWNVHATPEFSLQDRSWWYPVVGRLKYRGYFEVAKARRYGATLSRKGFDVYVGGVSTYSTLGWFHDPVLNTFVFESNAELAETLFHELAHQRLFIAGDTDFNEAFATAVAEEGLRRWMRATNDPGYEQYQIEVRRKEQFIELVATARARLAALYRETNSSPSSFAPACSPMLPPEMRQEKERVFEALRQDYARLRADWNGCADYDGWFVQPLNNAYLNVVEMYYRLVPGFRRLLQASDGDMEKFYKEVRVLAKMKKQERQHRLAGNE
jgi:predicted aminopeptidase